MSRRPRWIFGWNPDLTTQRSHSIPQRATMLAITRATMHRGTGVAMPTVTTLWRPPRPASPAASPIWARLLLIHSIASRTTAPALSVGRIGFEARILAYQDASSRAVARYDGFVAKFMGDGVLAYFGFPCAHEEDAERAVRAGLDLTAAVRTPITITATISPTGGG